MKGTKTEVCRSTKGKEGGKTEIHVIQDHHMDNNVAK